MKITEKKKPIPAVPDAVWEGSKPAPASKNTYDDGNIPKEDLPQDVIPDEVPRKYGPGGE